jgi:hypothetical protein
MGPGLVNVIHHDGCGCQMILNPAQHPWITYNALYGDLACDRCKTALQLPCPFVKENFWSGYAYPDLGAIEGELARFGYKHQDCEEPPEGTTAEGQPLHLDRPSRPGILG